MGKAESVRTTSTPSAKWKVGEDKGMWVTLVDCSFRSGDKFSKYKLNLALRKVKRPAMLKFKTYTRHDWFIKIEENTKNTI